MKYFLGGVNASGKTTLLHKIKEFIPYFEIVKGSKELMTNMNIGEDYEKLRNLPNDYKLEKLNELVSNLLAKHENMIFDGHYLNLIRGERVQVTGDWLSEFDAFLLMDISPDLAIKRIGLDTRDRALFPEGMDLKGQHDMYGVYIKENKDKFDEICSRYNKPGRVLNADLGADGACQEFLVFHESLSLKLKAQPS